MLVAGEGPGQEGRRAWATGQGRVLRASPLPTSESRKPRLGRAAPRVSQVRLAGRDSGWSLALTFAFSWLGLSHPSATSVPVVLEATPPDFWQPFKGLTLETSVFKLGLGLGVCGISFFLPKNCNYRA